MDEPPRRYTDGWHWQLGTHKPVVVNRPAMPTPKQNLLRTVMEDSLTYGAGSRTETALKMKGTDDDSDNQNPKR